MRLVDDWKIITLLVVEKTADIAIPELVENWARLWISALNRDREIQFVD